MRWTAPGREDLLHRVQRALDGTRFPAAPPGFSPLAPPRPMRTVLVATIDDGVRVVVKWHAPARGLGRIRRTGRGPREGRALRALAAAGVAVPTVLAYSDDDADLLVTEHRALRHPSPDEAPRDAWVASMAAHLARAHEAGVEQRDLHRANVALDGDEPVIVDAGGARVHGRPLSRRARIADLGRARHALAGSLRRTQRWRALLAYAKASRAPDPHATARDLAGPVERAAVRAARRYRRGRDRRATRTGRHFLVFGGPNGVRGVLDRDVVPDDVPARVRPWLAEDPPDSASLKRGGRVLRVAHPDLPAAGVLKRWAKAFPGRLPRPVRAFRRAVALRHRGVDVPRPWIAAVGRDGAGFLVSEWIDAPDLSRVGTPHAIAPDARRRALVSLGRALRAMHDADVAHRDLKAPNLLADLRGAAPRFWIVDVDGARVRRGGVPWRRRARDLGRLEESVRDASRSDRLRVLRAYADVLPRGPWDLGILAAHVRRHAERKRARARRRAHA
jgi:tRNA A-37 threonylcarbamoyl transferase component Bud32